MTGPACVAVLSLVLVAASGCSRGGKSTPTAPLTPLQASVPEPEPEPEPSPLAGFWIGTLTVRSVSPERHCVAESFERAVGERQKTRSGTAWSETDPDTVTFLFDPDLDGYPADCSFNARLDGNRFEATLRQCGGDPGFGYVARPVFVTCPSGRRYEITLRDASMTGTFDRARDLDAQRRSLLRARSGAETFDFILLDSVSLRKR